MLFFLTFLLSFLLAFSTPKYKLPLKFGSYSNIITTQLKKELGLIDSLSMFCHFKTLYFAFKKFDQVFVLRFSTYFIFYLVIFYFKQKSFTCAIIILRRY